MCVDVSQTFRYVKVETDESIGFKLFLTKQIVTGEILEVAEFAFP